MLNIYIGKDAVPNTLIFAFDPEDAFVLLRNIVTPITKDIVKIVEEGELVSEREFIDKLGCTRSIEYLSTSSKILILIALTDMLVNASELGRQAKNFLFRDLDKGNVFFLSSGYVCTPNIYPISLNGEICSDFEEWETALLEDSVCQTIW